MMELHCRARTVIHTASMKNFGTNACMLVYESTFTFCQSAGECQHALRQSYLANIMELGSEQEIDAELFRTLATGGLIN